MSLVTPLIGFGLRQVVGDFADDVAGVVGAVEQRFRDQSQKLPKALENAHKRAWQALGVALAGDGLLDRVKVLFASGDDKGVREQVHSFLKSNAASFDWTPAAFRQACLDELQRLRKSGRLSALDGSPADIARQAAGFRRHTDQEGLIEESRRAVGGVANALAVDCPNLARLLRTPTPAGPPLLAAAFCYFFRREVETDDELAHGLFFDGLNRLTESQAKAFGEMRKALVALGGRFDDLFEQLGRIEAVAVKTHGAVLDVQVELQRLGGLHLANAGEMRSLFEQVMAQLGQLGMTRGEVRPGNSFSIRGEDERRAVKALLARFRRLPSEDQRQVPALLNGLGKLQVGAGDFAEARRTFAEVVGAVGDPSGRAEASLNAYRAALEARQWDAALAALREAASLDPQRFAPFPMGKYLPVRILGAGGFGVAFLCRHNDLNAEMVVKAVRDDGLGRNVDDVLNEARLLNQVDHPCVIRLRDYGYMLEAEKARPYLVMDYFDGAPLQDWVREQALSSKDCLSVARHMAEGLQAAHQKGVLHRDVKPANVLVRRDGSVWQVKLIDFGLALRADAVSNAEDVPGSQEGTPWTSGGAGTLDYAAPEQLGRIPGVAPGAYSDVYGWAKTCTYGLFRTPHPLPKQWSSIRGPFAQLLEECLDENPTGRPADCEAVIARLNSIAGRTWVGMATDWGNQSRTALADWGSQARTALADFAKKTHGKIRFPCPKCQSEVSVEYDKAGTQLQCPNCSEQVQVPAAEGLAMLLVKWVTEKAIAGVPPLLTPAEVLAERYLKHHKFPNHGKRIDSLINWEATKNFTTGFMSGLGGLLTLPVALPAAFAASWIIQARMVAAVARISGWDLRDDAVHTFIAACLVGDVVKDIAKPMGLQIGTGLTKAMITRVPGEVLIRINQMIGFRLITKAGETGLVNLVNWIPVAGGVVGGSFDGYMCLAAGKRAKKLFYHPDSPPEPEQPNKLDT